MPEQISNQIGIYRWIVDHVPRGGKVLDIGCGTGELLSRLASEKNVRGTGFEISEECVMQAAQKGLSVHHGNAEEGLDHYGDDSFDIVVFSLSLQEMRDPRAVLNEAFRVGKKLIIVFPNFGNWRARWTLAVEGRAPRTRSLPYLWFESPNRHFFTILDWNHFCETQKWRTLECGFLCQGHTVRILPNLRAEVALYLMEANGKRMSSDSSVDQNGSKKK